MLDEKKVYKVTSTEGEELELEFNFKAFKRLHKITGNCFKAIDDFNNSTENRLELLPTMIKATSGTDLSLEEIEDKFLGFDIVSAMQMADIIFKLVNSELRTEVKVEVKEEGPIKEEKAVKKKK